MREKTSRNDRASAEILSIRMIRIGGYVRLCVVHVLNWLTKKKNFAVFIPQSIHTLSKTYLLV